MTGTSFKFVVESYNNSLTSEHKRSVIQNFAFLDFQGPIRMSDPDMKVYVLEDWPDVVHRDGRPTDRHMRRVFIGRWVRKHLPTPVRTILTAEHTRRYAMDNEH